jgi:hypothetical protein
MSSRTVPLRLIGVVLHVVNRLLGGALDPLFETEEEPRRGNA